MLNALVQLPMKYLNKLLQKYLTMVQFLCKRIEITKPYKMFKIPFMKKVFLVINIFKAKGMNAHEVEGVFWRKSNARKFLNQLIEEKAGLIGGQLYRIEKYIFPKEKTLQQQTR